jgi:hypothetical protein
MIEPADFFQRQAMQCRSQAERAANKTDREFWLDMARRWEGMLKPRHTEEDETLPRRKFGRPMFRHYRAA